MAGLRAALRLSNSSDSSGSSGSDEDYTPPAKHLVNAALEKLQSDGLIVASGSGQATRLKLSAAGKVGVGGSAY